MQTFGVCDCFLSSIVETESEIGSEAIETEGDGVGVATSASHTLWVDKYAPRQYTHLLSDDVSS